MNFRMKNTFYWVLYFLPWLSFAQPYNFRHYRVEEMLSNNCVFDIEQDHYGFMWFATSDGLNRFDGHNFKVFRHQDTDPHSLGSSHVDCLFLTTKKDLYVGTGAGLFRYNVARENFTAIPGTENENVIDVCEDRTGILYFLTSKEVYRYSPYNDKVELVLGASNGRCTSIVMGDGGNLWIGVAGGLLISVEAGSGLQQQFQIPSEENSNKNVEPVKILEMNNRKLLIGTRAHGLKVFDPLKGTFKSILFANSDNSRILHNRAIVKASTGKYWIGSESGIFIYDPETEDVVNLRKVQGMPSSLSDDAVYAIYRDKEDGMWIGTYFGGVNYCPKASIAFRQYLQGTGPQFLSGGIVRGIGEDETGNIWVGTEDNGLNKIDSKTGAVTQFLAGAPASPISYRNLHGLVAMGERVWIGTYFHGLDVINTNGTRNRHFDTGPSTFASNFVIALCKTRANKILLGTEYDVVEFDPQKSTFRTILRDLQRIPRYHNIIEDRQGFIWIGTRGYGLLRLNPKTQEIKNFVSGIEKKSLGHNYINDLFEDSKGGIWVATDGGGLCKLDNRQENFERYSLRDGMPSDYIYKVLEDGKGLIWASSSKGLVCLDPVTRRKRLYTSIDGLTTDQFNFSSGFRAKNGTMYFGSLKGLISFNPDQGINDDLSLAPVIITGLQINYRDVQVSDSSVIKESIVVSRKLTLPYNQSTISLDFSAPSYKSPGRVNYAFKMAGLHDEWVTLSNERRAYFTKLPPGNYTFFVKASGPDGKWQRQASFIHLQVKPPVWDTWWARVLYATVVLILAYYFFQRYKTLKTRKLIEKQKQYELQLERELYDSKLDFLSSVAHELNTPLTLIKGPIEEVMQHSDNAGLVQKYTGMISRNTDRLILLCQQLLDFRTTESHGYRLNAEEVDFSALVDENARLFANQAQRKSMECVLELPGSPIMVKGDKEALTKIVCNLFSNAIKFGEKRFKCKLTLEGEAQPCFVRLTVISDGPLIPIQMREKIFEPFVRLKTTSAAGGTGIGLSISKSLAELHQADLYTEQFGEFNAFVFRIACTGKP
jgi:signal transduction histidine kinase/ligand-binding sensor domain-containing protein